MFRPVFLVRPQKLRGFSGMRDLIKKLRVAKNAAVSSGTDLFANMETTDYDQMLSRADGIVGNSNLMPITEESFQFARDAMEVMFSLTPPDAHIWTQTCLAIAAEVDSRKSLIGLDIRLNNAAVARAVDKLRSLEQGLSEEAGLMRIRAIIVAMADG